MKDRRMSDLISRQAAIDALGNAGLINYAATGSSNGLIHAMNVIKGLPAAQPQRMRGHWIEIQAPDRDGNALYECSVCHSGEVHVPIVEVPFCWHCGARMDGGEQE